MEIVYLADHEDQIPKVAEWYFEEWGHLLENPLDNIFVSRLQSCLNKTKFPLVILAIDGEELLGAAQIKLNQMSIYPNKELWLAGIYVEPKYRGNNVAASLIKRIQEIAITLRVETLHLQTEDLSGGLYAKLGWKPDECVNFRNIDVMVMSKRLNA
ncbi:GNAT family N-acetyltransferase [Pseudoalteromonas sp. NZS127_1]|uniref:GNAT family N-acetyltransferase n=1 Tax=unclassified Pseudoalteromonas TaxID=194690 RepID=UPI0013FD326C|nr:MULTISPECIES: GNAT family N-acetyltransferase [unclassified Pseudoalteromonas]MBG9995969.1 GNAT family N-acetyltransferase [Pseudoalteromonas sp. NZS127_1]